MRRLPGFISLLPWTGCLGRRAHPPPWAMSWPCSPQQGFHFPGLVPHSFNERPRRLSNSCVTRQLTSPLWAAVAYLNSSHLGEESKLPKWDSRQGHTAWRRSHFQHWGRWQVSSRSQLGGASSFTAHPPTCTLQLFPGWDTALGRIGRICSALSVLRQPPTPSHAELEPELEPGVSPMWLF